MSAIENTYHLKGLLLMLECNIGFCVGSAVHVAQLSSISFFMSLFIMHMCLATLNAFAFLGPLDFLDLWILEGM